jgi:hypothetical protein
MIISDRYKFAFIHIPKCGGTTVKHSLAGLDDRAGLYSMVHYHEALGYIDFTHLPLSVMKNHFAYDYDCVRKYRSFALCRDPTDRFLSALLQRIVLYGSGRREILSRKEIIRQLEEVISYLSNNPLYTIDDYRYIYFERQCRYVCLDGERIVDRVFRLNELDRLYEELRSYTGIQLTAESRKNQSLYARNAAVRFLAGKVWPIGRALLPDDGVATLRHRFRRYIYVPAQEQLRDIVRSQEIQDFIQEYYARDLELFHSLGD